MLKGTCSKGHAQRDVRQSFGTETVSVPKLFRHRNCPGTGSARRRIPAVSVPQNPSWLRSCPVSVCFGPETLGPRPGIVKFRLSPRTNTCGLHAWPAVCHLPPGGCGTVSVPKQFRYRNSSGAGTVSVPEQFRYRNSFGTETLRTKGRNPRILHFGQSDGMISSFESLCRTTGIPINSNGSF